MDPDSALRLLREHLSAGNDAEDCDDCNPPSEPDWQERDDSGFTLAERDKADRDNDVRREEGDNDE